MEGPRTNPRRSWKDRLQKFLSRVPRIRIPFRKSRPPAHAGPKMAERRAAVAVASAPVARPVHDPAGGPRDSELVLVVAGGGAEASLEGERAPDPRPVRESPVRGESSFESDRSPPAKPAPPPARTSPEPGAQQSPRKASPHPKDAFQVFSDSAIVLLPLDPYRVVAWWEARPLAIEAARRRLGDENARLAVRFHEISLVDFDGSNANETIEVAAPGASGNYYLNVWSAGKCFVAELMVRAADGRFALLARSNFIELPRDGESQRFEDRRRRVLGAGSPLWRPRAVPEAVRSTFEYVAEAALASEDESPEEVGIVGLSGTESLEAMGAESLAAGRAAAPADSVTVPAGEGELESLPAREARIVLEAGGPSSWVHALPEAGRDAPTGISSLERPAIHEPPHLEVKADLVIYGRTQPGTDLVIDGVKVPVREDGTFDLRFALPRVVEPGSPPRARTPGRARRGGIHGPARGDPRGGTR